MEKSFTYEVIVGDNGSDDGSVDVIKEFNTTFNGNLKVIVHDLASQVDECTYQKIERNKLSVALAARGRFCVFGDGDDCWCDRSFVKDALKILEKDITLSAVVHDFSYSYLDGRMARHNNPYSGMTKSFEFISNGEYSHFGTIVLRNYFSQGDKLLQAIRLNDTSFLYYLSSKGNFYLANRNVYLYKQHSENTFSSADLNVNKFIEVVLALRTMRACKKLIVPLLGRNWRNFRYCLNNAESVCHDFNLHRSFNLNYLSSGTIEMNIANWDRISKYRRANTKLNLTVLILGGVITRIGRNVRRRFCTMLKR